MRVTEKLKSAQRFNLDASCILNSLARSAAAGLDAGRGLPSAPLCTRAEHQERGLDGIK